MRKLALTLLLISSTGFAKAAAGDSIWGLPVIHDIYFTFAMSSYYDTLLANHTADVYTQCDITFDGTSLPSCAVKMKGNSSFNNPSQKKSLKVDLNEYVSGQDYDGIKKFNLNNGFKDPTFIREKLVLDYMHRHGIHAPRCTYARVYFNNVYWGLYTLVEDINGKFLSQHYGNNNGNLFKGDPSGDLAWFGSTVSSYYNRYELDKTNTNDWTDLVNLINTINNSPASTYYTSLEDSLFGWDFLANMAMNNIFVNNDSYCGSGHNYYVYHDSDLMKWRWLPWDVNESFGTFSMSMTPAQLKTLAFDWISNPANRVLATKMMADATYRQTYIYTYCYLMQDFTNAYLDPYIDSVANVIRSDVYADPNKFFTNSDFETNLTSDLSTGNILGLKDFITARRASLESQFAPYGCYLAVNESRPVFDAFTLFPNPVSDLIQVNVPMTWINHEFTLDVVDMTGRVIQSTIYEKGTSGLTISVGNVSPGLYQLVARDQQGNMLSCRFTKST